MNKWMERIVATRKEKDSLKITDMYLPGTHDSGTAKLSCMAKMMDWLVNIVRCQEWSIAEQLNQGIRYLDIRVRYSDGKFYIVHDGPNAFMDCFCLSESGDYLYLEDVLRDCRRFLDANRNEFIVMSLKLSNSSGSAGDILTRALRNAAYDKLFYEVTNPGQFPCVGEAKGKVILLRRFDNCAAAALAYDFSGWGNADYCQQEGEMSYYLLPAPDGRGASRNLAMIQDVFGLAGDLTVDAAAAHKVACYKKACEQYVIKVGGETLLLNFLSGTLFRSIQGLAREVDKRMQTEHISKGVTVMDFPSTKLIQKIVDSNIKLKQD